MNADIIGQVAPLLFLFAMLYVLMIRPQQRKAKIHQEMLKNLHRGDRVITTGGIIGTVSKIIDDQEIQLEIADNVKVRFVRGMIADLVSKPQPAASAKTISSDSDSIRN